MTYVVDEIGLIRADRDYWRDQVAHHIRRAELAAMVCEAVNGDLRRQLAERTAEAESWKAIACAERKAHQLLHEHLNGLNNHA